MQVMHIINMGFPHKLTHTDCLEIVYLHLDFLCLHEMCMDCLSIFDFECFSGALRGNNKKLRACSGIHDRAKANKFYAEQGGFHRRSRQLRRRKPTQCSRKFAACSRLMDFRTCSKPRMHE